MSNHDRNGRDGRFDGKTYLYIRTNPADTGVEPLASGLDFWISPDIVVVKPGGAIGDTAVANELNHVQVTVTNAGGITAVDAYVEAFVADPSAVMTPATATLVGGGFATIPGYNTTSLAFPWTPSASEAGHRCLFGRVSLAIPFDSYVDPASFDVVGDRHVAQRNIHVVATAAKKLSFAFVVLNASDEEAQVLVRAEEVRAPAALRQLATAMGCEAARFGRQPLEALAVSAGRERVPLGEARRHAAVTSLAPPRALGGLVASRSRAEAADTVELELAPGEARRAVLHAARGREAGNDDMNAIRITQTDARGTVVGGLTVVVRSTA